MRLTVSINCDIKVSSAQAEIGGMMTQNQASHGIGGLNFGRVVLIGALVASVAMACLTSRSCNAQSPGWAVGVMTDQMVELGCIEALPCQVVSSPVSVEYGATVSNSVSGEFGAMYVYRCSDKPIGVFGDYVEGVHPYQLYPDGDGEFLSPYNMRRIPVPGIADPEMVAMIEGIAGCHHVGYSVEENYRICNPSSCQGWVEGGEIIFAKEQF